MKFYKIALALAAGVCLFASCSSEADDIVENIDNNVKVKKVLGVGTPTSVSRSSIANLDLSGHTTQDVHWAEGDKLSVFAEGHEKGDEFTWASWPSSSLHNQANFEGYTYEGVSAYYILYPAQDNARLLSTPEGPRLKFNIPRVQHAVDGSFDPAAGIQAIKASSIDTPTNLLNACSYFYITLEPGYSKVEIEVPDNTTWHLAGTVTADVHTGGVTIKGFEPDCSNSIDLVGTEAGGTYFIAFIPTSGFKNKLQLTLHKEAGVESYEFEKATDGLTFSVATYYDLGSYPKVAQ